MLVSLFAWHFGPQRSPTRTTRSASRDYRSLGMLEQSQKANCHALKTKMVRFLTRTKLSFAISAPWVVFMERPQMKDTGLTGLLKLQSTFRRLISIRNSLLLMYLKRKLPILSSRLPFASTILKRDLTLTVASHS